MTWPNEHEELFKRLQDLPKVPMSPKSQEKMLGELIKVEQVTPHRPFSRVNSRRALSRALAGTAGIVIAVGGIWTLSNYKALFTPSFKLPGVVSDQGLMKWKTYTNGRFGFSVEYPSTWKMGPRPNDGDGRYFTTPSGVSSFDNGYGTGAAKSDVMLQVLGTPNAVIGSGNGLDFHQMVAAFTKNLSRERKQPGIVSESYAIVPNKWIVDSVVQRVGHNGIQYYREYTSLSTNQTVSLTIPKNQSAKYMALWKHIENSFVPGSMDVAFMKIGNLVLGQTFSEIQTMYGKPDVKTVAHGNGAPEWIYKKSGLTLDGNPLWQISVSSPYGGSLNSGVHIGDSRQAVQKAYPNARVNHLPDGVFFTVESADHQYQITIRVVGQKVNEIVLSKTQP